MDFEKFIVEKTTLKSDNRFALEKFHFDCCCSCSVCAFRFRVSHIAILITRREYYSFIRGVSMAQEIDGKNGILQ